ncbi:MAG: alkaline phosphatase family protein [Chitinophagaceae bacterium]|nr:alkaline phosphatase family protein [Chitinophagaceae bacterium]MCW5925425.1 alkaline phosphatase family protein [Chitinophagaceae bacterium]
MFRAFICYLAVLLSAGMTPAAMAQAPENKPYVILLSLDGFRWNFPMLYTTPHLDVMAAEGVKAASLVPCFPSKTFPNHYSIITGLYPDHHGIVANRFADPVSGKTFALATAEKLNPGYYGGTPFWVVAEKQGIRTASYNWPGSEVKIKGIQPSIWKPYSETIPLAQRIDTIVHWLRLPPGERPHFISVYFEQPDKVLHAHGPGSDEARSIVAFTDSLVGILRTRLRELPFADSINLLVVSDHGMSATSPEQTITLSHYIPSGWLQYPATGSPVIFLKAAEGYYDSIAIRLRQIPHVKAYASGKIPRKLHFGKNNRALDFTVVADNGWTIVTHSGQKLELGNHGYDNALPDMHGIFYAIGPAFRKNYKAGSLRNIDIYELLGRLYNIAVPDNDGKRKKTKPILRK